MEERKVQNGTYDEYAAMMENFGDMSQGYQKSSLLEWINDLLPHLCLPIEASTEELRASLIDGTVLCSILNKLCPGSLEMVPSSDPGVTNVKRFLAAVEELGLPSFQIVDLEQGSLVPVLQCLGTLRAAFDYGAGEDKNGFHTRKRWDLSEVESINGFDGLQEDLSTYGQYATHKEEMLRKLVGTVLQPGPRDSVTTDLSATFTHQTAQKFHELLLKQGCYADLSDAKILEIINSYSFDNTSTQSLCNAVNQILEDIIQRKNGDLSNRVAYLLRKVMDVIQQRISNQAKNLKNHNNLFLAREEKYQSKLRVLESLALGTTEENEVVLDQLQLLKYEKMKLEEKKKLEEKDVEKIRGEKNQFQNEISRLKEELESTINKHESHCLQLEENAKEEKIQLEQKLKEFEHELIDSRKKMKEIESFAESKLRRWKKKERTYQNFINFQCGALQDLRASMESAKHEVLKTKRSYSDEFNYLGVKLKGLADAAENYHTVLAENRRLYNEVQDLKGNIRVYCRIRPFLPGQSKKHTTVEHVGENGELIIANPSKQGSHRLFKFNKVFGPTASQEEVFLDTQPLIRSVLDGYNVCIFAYGQTGSGKTYTMSGPSISSRVDWGVNYRALNDLFQLSQSRKSSIAYEVGVQMVEIYNEQVRDLLSNESSQKRLGIWSTAQPNGLAVPDASMHSVKSTKDVLELMHIGLMNRAVGATALNERSSRSHSVLTVHVRGTDLKTESILRGSLHLVDLAGSERVDRSEATGERLREAQHINKSLSALGDVIFALAQKNSHVPYRNSKLTQVLQSSLGGQAKTLMFVQLNPDTESYSETISTLKFAERVSGVELGAARSNKEGRDVRDLMEQVASLKDVITKKDEELEQLQKTNVNGVKSSMSATRYRSSSPRKYSMGTPRQNNRLYGGKGSGPSEKNSDMDNCSEYSEKHSESGSQQSIEDLRNQKEFSSQLKLLGDANQNLNEDFDLLGFGDADSEERLSDISDGGLSMGTETDGSIASVVEFTLFPESAKTFENTKSENAQTEQSKAEKVQTQKTPTENNRLERTQSEVMEKPTIPSRLPKPPQKSLSVKSSRLSLTTRSSSKVLSGAKKPTTGSSSASKAAKRWQ
ncbi:kinesin-like protein KIN-14J isoform X2 [Humulus lupulus]|uniref:kinesin-like protein KIN-14J isoform X2 n=1 Tax=Humulus lupulus TaxID=3486 RepID=UPI002B4014BB|nr:kinesin-like protein KIN-14J isoform X2 [Humulus lupulus]